MLRRAPTHVGIARPIKQEPTARLWVALFSAQVRRESMLRLSLLSALPALISAHGAIVTPRS